MKPKKNPQQDLSKNSSLYFVIGLLTVLALTYTALEWKSFEKSYDISLAVNQPDHLIEEITPENFKIEPPKIKKVIAQKIEIKEDDAEIIETEVIDTEVDPEEKILEPDDIDVVELIEEVPVNWVTIEEVPVFPGCENEKDKRACFNVMMQKHIRKHFRYPEMAQEMGQQGRVSTQFTINKDGSISAIKKRGPHKLLENEAERILSKLPKMKPGMQRGTAVKVPFMIPINFKLE